MTAWLAAGFIRNLVWDQQHGYLRPTPLPDIDVIYLDAAQQSPAADHYYEALLTAQLAAALPSQASEPVLASLKDFTEAEVRSQGFHLARPTRVHVYGRGGALASLVTGKAAGRPLDGL